MKKLFTLILLLCIATALIAPKFVGDTLHKELDNYIASVNQNGVYELRVLEREQSWFNSTALIQMTLNMPQAAAQSMDTWQFTFEANAQHGPLLLKNGLALGLLDWTLVLSSEAIPANILVQEEAPIYQVQGSMNFLGTSAFKDRAAAMSYNDAALNRGVSTGGWQGSGQFSQESFDYEGNLVDLSMSIPNIYKINIRSLRLSSHIQGDFSRISEGGFYDGSASLSLGEMQLNNLLENENTSLKNALIVSSVDFDENTGLADINTQWTVDELSTALFQLQNMSLEAEFNNMQEAFFKAYQKMNKAIIASPERAQDIMQTTMEQHLLGQLQAEPEFNIRHLRAVLNGGSIDVFSNNKIVDVQALPDTLANNDFWYEHLRSESSIKVEESAALLISKMILRAQLAGNPQLAEMDEQQLAQVIEQQSLATLQGLISQGLLVKENGIYSISFSLDKAEAVLNKQAIPLPN